MGWRIHQRINIGWGFRVNLSKSGIGFSWGVPGYRKTWKANGGTRTTYSIPRTGISYVEETSAKRCNRVSSAENCELCSPDTIIVDGQIHEVVPAQYNVVGNNNRAFARNAFVWLGGIAILSIWLFMLAWVPDKIWTPILVSLCAIYVGVGVVMCLLRPSDTKRKYKQRQLTISNNTKEKKKMEKINWNLIVKSYSENPRDVITVPSGNRKGKWFYVSVAGDEVFISEAKEHLNSSKLKMKRILNQNELEKVYNLYVKRKQGLRINPEVLEATVNGSYWFGIFNDLSL